MAVFGIIPYVVFVVFRDSILSFINSLLLYLRYINQRYLPYYDPNQEMTSILIEAMLAMIGCFVALMLLLTSLFFFLFPRTSCLIGSIIPDDTFILIRFPIVYIFPQYMTVSTISTASFLIIIMYLYGTIGIPFIVKEFRLGRKCYASLASLRKPKNLMLAYRTAQILHEKFRLIFQYLIVPTQFIITNLFIFCCVMIIKFGQSLKPSSRFMLVSWALFGITFWASYLWLGGYLYLNGNRVLKSWKYHPWNSRAEKNLMSKFQKSCRPIMIHYGRTYVIKKVTVLKFLRGISRGVLRTLLTVAKD
ncbi:unnamed protein product [Orchesella dallaii]|uniref:Uncharacterized protein n=1 Tax=Orchesella dallaii TaxID=48710 RepID=A0ABP1RFE8_9HEXA